MGGMAIGGTPSRRTFDANDFVIFAWRPGCGAPSVGAGADKPHFPFAHFIRDAKKIRTVPNYKHIGRGVKN